MLCSIRIYRDLFSLGSMVQKGKFSAGADAFVSTLKKVDLLHTQKYIAHTHFIRQFSWTKECHVHDRLLTQR